ncbi:LOW QUALITY PROTEIN: guanylate kinase-associated family member mars [Aphomia sociella]
MERSFDLGALLKNHEKKHKLKPSQFLSVANGIKNRLETNLKTRKSCRLSVFDKIRNLPKCDSPPPLSDAQLKIERRRQQLQKWKEDKEKRKKETAAQKKKPFLTGVPHAPLQFVPPPPPKPMPSTSGRVTRSQSARNNIKQNANSKQIVVKKDSKAQSFAPKNAAFRPPEIKNLAKVPILAPASKTKNDIKELVLKFSSISNNVMKDKPVRQTRTRTVNKPMAPKVNTRKNTKEVENKTTKGRVTKKSSPIPPKVAERVLTSSSSSDLGKVSPDATPVSKNKTPRKSIRRESKNVTPKNQVPKSESSSEEKLRSPKMLDEIAMTPEQIAEEAKRISPCVTLSRGKDNARREMRKKMDEGLLDEDSGDVDSVDHFRKQLNSEIARLTEMCDVWEKIREQTLLMDSVQDEVLGAVGQARLLMSSKLQQFSSLVERCARPEPGAALVTAADLHGFWDMVFMQIENIDMRFKRLEERRGRGWAEAAPEPAAKPPRRRAPRAVTAAPAATSRLRDLIAAARKAKKEQEEQSTVAVPVATEESKTFEAGFFRVQSPVRNSSGLSTPTRPNMLKAVLSSEAKKASASKTSSSFAMLRASIMSRNLEADGVAPLPQTPLTPVNIHATPGRSILKSTNKAVTKSGKKSIKVVLFNESDTEQDITNKEDFTENKDAQLKEDNTEINTDSGVSSMDIDKDIENKENSKRKSRLVRQDAMQDDRSPVITRSRRKSQQMSQLDEGKSKRSSRRKTLQEPDDNAAEEVNSTHKRSSRRRKSTNLQSVIA